MKKIYKYLLVAGVVGACGMGHAQDFHLSQYDAAALNFNPAMTGMFKGQWRLHGHYRNQWRAVATKPFTTGLISFDAPVKNWGLGAHVANFRAGIGNFNVFTFLAAASYDIKLDKNNNHHLALGVQGGFFQKSVNPNNLTFGVQYTPTGGGGFDNAVSSGEAFAGNSMLVHDLNAGFMYYYGKEQARVQPFVGGSFFHLTQPVESFFGANNTLPMRWVGNIGAKINISDKIQLLPKFFMMGEKNAREFTAAIHMHYYLENQDAYIIFGPTFRNTIFNVKNPNQDAAIIEGGVKWKRFIYRLSYDINTSSLKTASNGRGGIEFSLTYIMSKYDPNPVKTCPRL